MRRLRDRAASLWFWYGPAKARRDEMTRLIIALAEAARAGDAAGLLQEGLQALRDGGDLPAK